MTESWETGASAILPGFGVFLGELVDDIPIEFSHAVPNSDGYLCVQAGICVSFDCLKFSLRAASRASEFLGRRVG